MPDIPPILDRRKQVHSFSSLNTYLNCPHQYEGRYVTKATPFTGSDASRYGDRVHEAMEKRIGQGTPLPVEFAQWESFAAPFDNLPDTFHVRVEQQYAITIDGAACDYWAPTAWFRGRLDLTVVSPDFQTAYILDHKSGKPWEKPLELETSAMLLKSRHPDLTTINGQYFWARENKLGKLYDLSDVVGTFRYVQTLVSEIERDVKLRTFEKRVTGLCPWCPRKDCENHPEHRS